MNNQIQVVARAEDILAGETGALDLFCCLFQHSSAKRHFAANVNERGMRLNSERCDQRSFDDGVWIFLDQQPILECAGFAFVGVTNQILGFGIVFGDEAPLHAGGKSGAAPASEP